MTHILFVDDEIKVLEGLGRMLRAMRREWDMEFTHEPQHAVEMLRETAYDAIVVDMQMPQLDGAQLLAKARELRPGTARIVLSGHAKTEATLRSVGLAHQYLAKPCDAQTLRATVARACDLRRLLHEAGLADTVCQLGNLPSLPRLYQAMTEELSREDTSLQRISAIVGKDIAMTAKVLQLVNSAFFGLGRRVRTIQEAINYLGVDVIRSLVASQSAFEAFDVRDLGYFQNLWHHSTLTGALARRICARETGQAAGAGEALQAGMLHDIGSLILAARRPEEYSRVLDDRRNDKGSAFALEQELFGCDHGRIGAYMMGLWGLADPIVEAIAYHHSPSECSYEEFSPLTAVHVGSALIHEVANGQRGDAKLDMQYLEAVGCADKVPAWRAEAERMMSNGGSNE